MLKIISPIKNTTVEQSINKTHHTEKKTNISTLCYQPPSTLFKPWLHYQQTQNSFSSSFRMHLSLSPTELSNPTIESEIVSQAFKETNRHEINIQEKPPSKTFYRHPHQNNTSFNQAGTSSNWDTWKNNTFSLCPPSSNKRIFSCPYCRYLTDRKNNLKRHVVTMHRKCDRTLECCGFVFNSKAALRDHVIVFHNAGYSCYYCGRNFCRKALLKRHLAVHSGRKDFSCNHCDYATSHKSNLDRHNKIHKRPDRVHKTFEDPLCSLSRTSNNFIGDVKETNQTTNSSTSELSTCSSPDLDLEDSVSLCKKTIESDILTNLNELTQENYLSSFNSHLVPAKVPISLPLDSLNSIGISAHLSPVVRLSNFQSPFHFQSPLFNFQSPSFNFQKNFNYSNPVVTFDWLNASGPRSYLENSNNVVKHLFTQNANSVNSKVNNSFLNNEKKTSTNSSLENFQIRNYSQSSQIITENRHNEMDLEIGNPKPSSSTEFFTLSNGQQPAGFSTVLEKKNFGRHELPSLSTSVSSIFRLVDVISSDWEKTKLLNKLRKRNGSPDTYRPQQQDNISYGNKH